MLNFRRFSPTKLVLHLTGYSAFALLAASCSTPKAPTYPTPQPMPPQPPVVIVQKPPVVVVQPRPTPVPTPAPAPVMPRYGSFSEWKISFAQRASQQGYNRQDIERLLVLADYNEQAIRLDRSQAEFVKMPWEYVDSALSSGRVSAGRSNYANQQSLLSRIENQYGVPASIVTAIWGMESSYGKGTGNSSLPSSLATLAYDGRRKAFAEEQLLAMLQLVQRGDVDWSQLKGSWAGGMGHTQFIPQTWLVEGVDGDGDGHKNPWNMADALSSTASYLSRSGWQRGVDAVYEVRLPAGFDYRNLGSKKSLGEWQALGVQFMGYPSNRSAQAELWLPAGKEGPALLITNNFNVIKVYNNSSNYALAVSLLAKAIIGQPTLQQDWPRYEQPLANYQVRQLQERLTAQGFDTQGTDGIAGNNTRMAFARWQASRGQIPDGFISQRSAAPLIGF